MASSRKFAQILEKLAASTRSTSWKVSDIETADVIKRTTKLGAGLGALYLGGKEGASTFIDEFKNGLKTNKTDDAISNILKTASDATWNSAKNIPRAALTGGLGGASLALAAGIVFFTPSIPIARVLSNKIAKGAASIESNYRASRPWLCRGGRR